MRIERQEPSSSHNINNSFEQSLQNTAFQHQNMPFKTISNGPLFKKGVNDIDNIPSREIAHNQFTVAPFGTRSKVTLTDQYDGLETPLKKIKLVFAGVHVQHHSFDVDGQQILRFSLSKDKETFEAHPNRDEANPITNHDRPRTEFSLSTQGNLGITYLKQDNSVPSELLRTTDGEKVQIIGWDDVTNFGDKLSNDTHQLTFFQGRDKEFMSRLVSASPEEQREMYNNLDEENKKFVQIFLRDVFESLNNQAASIDRWKYVEAAMNLGFAKKREGPDAPPPNRR